MRKLNVCVLGATGMVGKEMIKVLEERNFPVDQFLPLASSRTAGSYVTFRGKEYEVGSIGTRSTDIAKLQAKNRRKRTGNQFMVKAFKANETKNGEPHLYVVCGRAK